MKTLYGNVSGEAVNYVRTFGLRVQDSINAFSPNWARVESSVARHFARYYDEQNTIRKALDVAKKTFNDSTWKGFISCTLSQEAKDRYAVWDIEDSDVWDGLATYGEKGYKFSLTFSKGNSNWIATYTGTEDAGRNAGWAVSAFANDPYNASRVLLFKVSVILPENWKDFKAEAVDAIG